MRGFEKERRRGYDAFRQGKKGTKRTSVILNASASSSFKPHLLFCLQLPLFAFLRAREGMELNLVVDVDAYTVRTIHIRVRGTR